MMEEYESERVEEQIKYFVSPVQIDETEEEAYEDEKDEKAPGY